MRGSSFVATSFALIIAGSVAWAASKSEHVGRELFADGAISLWGVNDGTQCTGLCIRTERRQTTLLTFVYDEAGRLVDTSSYDLAGDLPSKEAGSSLVLYRWIPEAGTDVLSDLPPPAPPGGTGVVTRNETYTSEGRTWVTTTYFHYLNNVLKNVTSSTVVYTNPP